TRVSKGGATAAGRGAKTARRATAGFHRSGLRVSTILRVLACLACSIVAAVSASAAGRAEQPEPTPLPRSLTWSPSSRIAFAARSGGIWAVDSDGSGLRRLGKVGGADSELALSPDGQTLVIADRGRLYLIRSDGTGLRRLMSGFLPSWSPDGKWIGFLADSG